MGAYDTIAPRQSLTPTPYAIAADNLTGTLPATQLTGALPSAQLSGTYSAPVTLNNAGNSLAGNGSGLTSLNANNLSSGTVADAGLSANVALLNRSPQMFTGTNSFAGNVGIGTTTPAPSYRLTRGADRDIIATRSLATGDMFPAKNTASISMTVLDISVH